MVDHATPGLFDSPPRLGRTYLRAVALLVAVAAVVALLGWLYALAPVPNDRQNTAAMVAFGILALALYAVLIIWSMSGITRARHPLAKGVILLAALMTTIILSYSWLYVTLSGIQPGSFSEALSKTTAVYFTVTVLSTVGFGDIHPVTDGARMLVTSQMLVGLTLLTAGVRVIVETTRRAQANRAHTGAPKGTVG